MDPLFRLHLPPNVATARLSVVPYTPWAAVLVLDGAGHVGVGDGDDGLMVAGRRSGWARFATRHPAHRYLCRTFRAVENINEWIRIAWWSAWRFGAAELRVDAFAPDPSTSRARYFGRRPQFEGDGTVQSEADELAMPDAYSRFCRFALHEVADTSGFVTCSWLPAYGTHRLMYDRQAVLRLNAAGKRTGKGPEPLPHIPWQRAGSWTIPLE